MIQTYKIYIGLNINNIYWQIRWTYPVKCCLLSPLGCFVFERAFDTIGSGTKVGSWKFTRCV